MPLDIELDWDLIEGDRDHRWALSRVLYALSHPETDQILYLGKAEYQSVRQRLACRSKDGVWNHVAEHFGVEELTLRIGEFITDARLTVELLADTESLLIKRLQPCCNVQATQSRITRPGLRVTCSGDWPERRDRFVDR